MQRHPVYVSFGGFTGEEVAAVSTLELHRPLLRTQPSNRSGAARCRRKFLRFFPDGFRDETYLAWERDYKWKAHEQWGEHLSPQLFRRLLRDGEHAEAAAIAVRIESRTNLLFSFEKM